MAEEVEEVSIVADPATREQPSDSVGDDENTPGTISVGEQTSAADSTKTASTEAESESPVTRTRASDQPNCVFCRIVAKELSSEIIYEDADFVCFIDRSPAAAHHYLVTPRQHIRDARTLSIDQLPIIDKMAELGQQVLAERGGSVDDVRMGFHWPPFLMVRHLHMHVISPASQMSWLHRNIVFRKDSFAFTSPTATMDYLRKSLNK